MAKASKTPKTTELKTSPSPVTETVNSQEIQKEKEPTPTWVGPFHAKTVEEVEERKEEIARKIDFLDHEEITTSSSVMPIGLKDIEGIEVRNLPENSSSVKILSIEEIIPSSNQESGHDEELSDTINYTADTSKSYDGEKSLTPTVDEAGKWDESETGPDKPSIPENLLLDLGNEDLKANLEFFRREPLKNTNLEEILDASMELKMPPAGPLDEQILNFISVGKSSDWKSINSYLCALYPEAKSRTFSKQLKRTLNALVASGKIQASGHETLDNPHWAQTHNGSPSQTLYRSLEDVNIMVR